ncbi:MAG: LuxR C-terminal-related transcriptional regulator [Chloroflexota bacterium]
MENNSQPIEPLNERELDILAGMSDGLTNKEIAAQLFLSYDTVRWYAKRMFQKLNVSSRAEAVSVAYEHNLLESTSLAQTDNTNIGDLPTYRAPFIGRKDEIRDIASYLARDEVRVVTIVGTGGSGKTRLAVEVGASLAASFPDGIYFISLNDPQLALESFEETLLRCLHLKAVRAEGVLQHLAQQQSLLIFDNFEESPDQTAHLTSLLEVTHNLKVLVTSQAPINLHQEWLYRIKGLSLAPVDNGYPDAVSLFIQRARQVNRQFDVAGQINEVRQICNLLGGYPLAIELAASWVRALSCADILADLNRSFDMLASDASDLPHRHRSIKAVFDYAWNLLTDDQRQALRRLAVFEGPFGVEVARQIADVSTTTLATLIDRSLIGSTASGQYQIQHLLRGYALERLIVRTEHAPKSNVALAMHALIKGEFDRVEELAEALLDLTQDAYNAERGFALALLSVIDGTRGNYTQGLQLARSSISLTQNFHLETFFGHLGLGIAHTGTGDMTSAKTAIRSALDSGSRVGIPAFRNLCVPVIALIAADSGQFRQSVALCHYASLQSTGLPSWLLSWSTFATLQDDLRSIMTEPDFDEAWELGGETPADDLIALDHP